MHITMKKSNEKQIEEVREIFRQKTQRRKDFVDQYGQLRPPTAVTMQGKATFIIDGSIYMQAKEGPYSFVNAIHDYALIFFGEQYLEQQERLNYPDRHPAIQWMHTYVDHLQALEKNEPLPESIGAMGCWTRFAYDIYTIRNNSTLEKELKRRLLDKQSFQSARHELWVASLFVAAGFDIEYEDEQDNTRKHPEFVATHKDSGLKIAVEAKSKHRRGVKGFRGGGFSAPGEKANIRDLVLDAYAKDTEDPLYVFIDLNLPSAKNGDFLRWNKEIESTMKDLALEGYADPCPANIVFFHNDPSHYLVCEELNTNHDKLWICYFEAKSVKKEHPAIDMCEIVLKAHQQRVSPPDDFVDW